MPSAYPGQGMGGSGQERVIGTDGGVVFTVTYPDAAGSLHPEPIDATSGAAVSAAANDRLADAERKRHELLAFHSPTLSPDPDACNLWSFRFRSDPLLAVLIVDDAASVGSRTDGAPGVVPSVDTLIDRLTSRPGPNGAGTGGPTARATVVVRVAAAVEIGGFDPTMPELGLADLVTRAVDAGWHVHGIDHHALPFVDSLHFGLDVLDWFRAEARWLQLHAQDSSASADLLATLAERTEAALDQVDDKTLTDGDVLSVLRAEAARQWRGAAAHEVQDGVGVRADWRFLLPAGTRDHTLIVGDDPARWNWLIDDGWTQRVSNIASGADPADVAVVGPDHAIGDVAGAVGAGGSICVLRQRKPLAAPGRGAGKAEVAELGELGFGSTRRYLVIPDLQRPKRFIPLDHEGGLAWLSSPSPPPQAGGLSRSNLARRRLARLLGREVSRLTGDIIVVGQRPPTSPRFAPAGLDPDQLPSGTSDVIVLTSGFDEGSRAVLLPLAAGIEHPRSVVKISSRPAYNRNVDGEATLIATVSSQITQPGLLPRSSGTFDVGTLRGSAETYAGRWSGSDVLNEQDSLPARQRVLDLVAGAIIDLGEQTTETRLTWSSTAFETHVGGWFDRLEDIVEPSPTIAALRLALAERSDQLDGLAIPLVRRHYDVGPWNVVFNESPAEAATSPVTIVDWELAPPRSPSEAGLGGADLLYFVKYWLHVAMDVRSADDELGAFPFLARPGVPNDPRANGIETLGAGLDRLGIDRAFVPLLAAHVWSEAACYTAERRRQHGGDPGSPYRYLQTLARHRHRFLATWPPGR